MSSISWDVAIGLAFVVGLLLLGIGSSMLRKARATATNAARWPQLVDDGLAGADKSLRADMIDRLSIVDSEWSRHVLHRARDEERDPELVAAINAALSV